MSNTEPAEKVGTILGILLVIFVVTFAFASLTVGLGIIPLVAAVWGVSLPFWPTLLTVWLVVYMVPNKGRATREVVK